MATIINPYRFAAVGGGLDFDKTDLQAWWDLDDDSTWADSHTNGYHLTEDGTGVTNVANGGADGTSDSADFPGTSGTDYLYRTDESWMDLTSDWTATMWVKLDTTSGFQIIMDHANGRWSIYMNATKLTFYVTQAVNVNDLNLTLSAGTWYFIAARRNANLWDLRANTTDETQYNNTGNHSGGTGSLGIGRRTSIDTNYMLNGQMQRCSIWHRRLSDAELDDLYNSGNGVSYADL